MAWGHLGGTATGGGPGGGDISWITYDKYFPQKGLKHLFVCLIFKVPEGGPRLIFKVLVGEGVKILVLEDPPVAVNSGHSLKHLVPYVGFDAGVASF